MSRLIDLTGKRFNKLIVLERTYNFKSTKALWRCRCDCGVITDVLSYNLRSGHSGSCGCGKDGESKVIHGHKRRDNISPTYSTWRNMWNRCTNPKMDNYKYYGGRGITICERWNTFENFLEDMGERPEGKFIDRIDNNGHYTPENCKWSTHTEQMNNRG